jgi:hypothetical protein
MQIMGGAMQPPQEVILSGNEQLGSHGNEFGRFGDDKNEGPPRPRIGDVLSIHLSQQPGSSGRWTLIVYVQIAQGWFQLGPEFETPAVAPAVGGDPPSRTVGFASCPGAIGWKVLARCPTINEIGDLVIQSSTGGGGGNFGVTPNPFSVG